MKKILLVVVGLIFLNNLVMAQNAMTDQETRPEAPTVSQKNIVTVNHIDLYPNPVSEYLNVKIDNSTLENVEFEIYNIIGNSLDIRVEKAGDDAFKIDIKDYFPGYYLLVVKDPLKRFNKSFKFQKN